MVRGVPPTGPERAVVVVAIIYQRRRKEAIRWVRPALFLNNWTDFNKDTHGLVEYTKDPFGFVHLRGLAKRTSGGSTTLPLFILPKGYRPRDIHIFSAQGLTSAPAFVTVRLDVKANGEVLIATGDGSGYVSLDGITFRAEQ